MEGTADQLFKTLSEYNATTNAIMEKIAKALIPLGMAILGILFMIELANTQKKFQEEGGGLTIEILTNIAMKYIIAYFFIMTSGYIIDSVVWFTIQVSKWIHSFVSIEGVSETIPEFGKVPFWAKPVLFLFQITCYVFVFLSSVVVKILIFLRGVQLYVIKALAPLFFAFFVNDELRTIAMGYLKTIFAYALQGTILILLLGLLPILTVNDFLEIGSFEGGIWVAAGALVLSVMKYVALILKYIAIILLLVGSQGLAKRLVGAM